MGCARTHLRSDWLTQGPSAMFGCWFEEEPACTPTAKRPPTDRQAPTDEHPPTMMTTRCPRLTPTECNRHYDCIWSWTLSLCLWIDPDSSDPDNFSPTADRTMGKSWQSTWSTPSTCSSLTSHFSAPNHCKDMKLFVRDPNTSKNAWNNFQVFLLLKIGRTNKNPVSVI